MATVPRSFDPQRCLSEMEEIEMDLSNLTANLTEAQFQASPSGGWPIGYCVEHLILTGNAFVRAWDIAMPGAKAHPMGADRGYSWWERILLGFFEPPYRMKTKTTRLFVPASHRPMQEVIRRFLCMHREVGQRLETAGTADAGSVKVQSPFAARVRYPLGFSFDLALAHERRHIWQAWQIRRVLQKAD